MKMGCREALRRRHVRQAWGPGEEEGGKSLRRDGAARTAGAWGPGAGDQALQALGRGFGVLLLEGLRRKKT